MENFRIRRAEFLNRNSLLGRNSTKIFFAPGAEIVFQHYRSKADISLSRFDVLLARSLAPFLAPAPGALVLRSDVERKALYGVPEHERLPSNAYRAEVRFDDGEKCAANNGTTPSLLRLAQQVGAS
jgi:hypothetical protein